MGLTEITGDLFDLGFPALGHGCNCTGVMGAGIALQFRHRYPQMYEEYRQFCEEGVALPGDVYPYEAADGKLILNMLTQPVPGPTATLELIESAVRRAIEMCQEHGIKEMAIPRIGAGIGGLKWSTVRERLETVMEDYPGFSLIVAVLDDPGKVHPDIAHLSRFPHLLLKVDKWEASYGALVASSTTGLFDPDDADLITSRIMGTSLVPTFPGPWHTIMLDLDVPATLVPSTTPGHSHLYIDVPVRWEMYQEILAVLAKAKILEKGYVGASVHRGFTSLRLPWVRKIPPPAP